MKIILATRNHKKTEELRRMLAGTDCVLQNLTEFPACPEVVEGGATFQENATKKACQVAAFTGFPALADDSGLVVEALGGAPGIHSARYAGPNASDAENLDKVLWALRRGVVPGGGVPVRVARFECVLSLAHPDGRVRHFAGRVDGQIIASPQGSNGFGYDPVFVPDGFNETFAEMSAARKDAISHRSRALAALVVVLRGSKDDIWSD